MNASIRNRLRLAAVLPRLGKLRPELQNDEIAAYLGARVEIDSETGLPTTDVDAVVAGWIAENPHARAAEAPADKPAPAALGGRELPPGKQSLASVLVAELQKLANPTKTPGGGF